MHAERIELVARRYITPRNVKRAAAVLAVFSVIGFLILPPIIKSVLLKKLSETLHRDVTIQTVRFNPFMLSVTVRGLEVKEPGSRQKFFSFDELYVNLQAMSLVRRGVVVREILLKNPYVNVVRNDDMSFNFSDLLQLSKQTPGSGKNAAESSPLRFSVNNIQLVGASIDFMDEPKHTRHTVRDASISIPFISNLPYYEDIYVQPAFSATVNGHAVAFKGNAKPFADSLETSITLDIRNLDIPYYLAYSPVPLDFKMVSGYLDTMSSISYVQYKERRPTLSLSGTTSFRQITITDNADAPLVSFPRIDISVSSSDLMSLNVHFAKIGVHNPEINVVQDRNGRLNLRALIPEQSGKQPDAQRDDGKGNAAGSPEPEKKSLPTIEADEMMLAGGKITFADFSEGRKFKTSLEDIQAKIRQFSTARDKKAEAEVSFRTDSQEAFHLASTFSVQPRAAEGAAEASRVVLKKYLPYLEKFVNFRIEGGELTVQTKYAYQQTEKEPDVRISDFNATVNSLRLRKTDEKKDFLSIPEASVKDLSVDLTKKEAIIGDISSQKGSVLAKRYRGGALLFSTLVKVSEHLEPAAKPVTRQRKQAPPEMPWVFTVKNLLLDRYTISYEDEMPADPVTLTLDRVRVKGENLSTVRKARGKLAVNLQVGKRGRADASGNVTIDPPAANLKLALKDIPVLAFQSYFTDLVKIIVTDGGISSKGTVSFAYTKETGPKVRYKGEASLNHFASVDKVEAQDFLKWDSLHVAAMDISYAPLVASIGAVALTDFYSRVIVNADGSINLQNVMEKKGAVIDEQAAQDAGKEPASASAGRKDVRPSAPPADTPGKLIKIDTVTLQGGTVNFSDYFIKPNFSTNMLEVGGRVTGLSSEETKMADVDLRGKLENYAPLEITGRVNPLRDDLFIDLKISFKDMDLSPLTPYSGRYIGYTIEKGKLALNLQYLIEKKKLDAQNRILLDQFTLGSSVDSPDATKLPVRLAIALLKNRRGEINLDVPVSGQIDDPQFSLGRIILKILVNLLVKAATSPFALLGALFGGGEELSYMEFDPGLHDLNAQSIKKLDTLIKALNDRPALKIDIEGHADPEKDREGLKQYLFQRKVKAQKLKDLAKKGGEAVSVDAITVAPDEYPKYLKAAYKAEKFPKPRNIIGMAKDLPVPEMEKLMLTHIEVKEDDLRQLASERALAVKDHILKSGKVEPERVFLIEPKSVRPEKKEKVSDSRVDFRLK